MLSEKCRSGQLRGKQVSAQWRCAHPHTKNSALENTSSSPGPFTRALEDRWKLPPAVLWERVRKEWADVLYSHLPSTQSCWSGWKVSARTSTLNDPNSLIHYLCTSPERRKLAYALPRTPSVGCRCKLRERKCTDRHRDRGHFWIMGVSCISITFCILCS